jgi:hypothetical protein
VPEENLESLLEQAVGGEVGKGRVGEAERIAREIRRRSKAAADAADRTAARQVAQAIEKERSTLADAERGGTMALIRGAAARGIHMTGLVSDRVRFAAHFERKTKGPPVDHRTLANGAREIADGAVVEFPPGRWSWRTSALDGRKAFPEDLLLKGAGRDRTILVLDELSTRHEIRSLTFSDLTIDCNDDYMTDLRYEGPAVIRLIRCRVIGFDMGAGGSVMLSARNSAFLAEDTSFEGGHGRAPGSGNLFRVSGALLARMERCSFYAPLSSIYDRGSANTYVFSECRFLGFPESFARTLERAPAGVSFLDCRMEEESPDAAFDRRLAFASVGIETSSGPGPTISGPDGMLPEGTTGAATIAFGAGKHHWQVSRSLGAFRDHLTVIGAGMNQTLLKLNSSPGVRAATYRDLTLDAGGGDAIRRASRPGALTLIRCRVIGFDTGAGGSTAFEFDNGLFTAEDCRFEVGYGRSPDHGNLFRSSNSLVARFDRCTIRLPRGRVFSSGALALFRNCEFTDLDPNLKSWIEKPGRNLSFRDCSVRYRPKDDPKRRKRVDSRPLSEINPDWGKGHAK